ncbi:MAG: hypothetical protein CO108_13595 [Deltaproteobacteria bacterium CG_4_9_14_3_um_filter_63_12]|nr:MAG: hypothetical protein CO108_13595 [Deltaproteobacteria bacterium CG_4_9_14_3_um_filter_63_12]
MNPELRFMHCAPRSLSLLLALGMAATFVVACDDGGGKKPAADTVSETSVDVVEEIDTPIEETTPDLVEELVEPPPLFAPLRVAFAYRDPEAPSDPVSLYIASYTDGENLRKADLAAMTTNIDCYLGGTCYLNQDLSYFVFHTGTGELRIAPIGAGPSVADSDLQLVASDVPQSSIQFAGHRLAYVSVDRVYYMDLSGGLTSPKDLGYLLPQLGDGINYQGGGIAMGTQGDFLLVYRYDLSSLGVWKVSLATGEETFMYRFGIPRAAGSTFGGTNPISVSADGETAVILVEGITLYGTCTGNADCTDVPEGTCQFYTNDAGVKSSTGLCGANQSTLQRFSLTDGNLGTACSEDTDCSAPHRCLIDPTTLLDGTPKKICSPRSYTIGPKSPAGCTLRGVNQFADVAPKLRRTPNDDIVFLGKNDCGDLNISNNAVVTLSADLDPTTLTYLEGPYDHDFGQSFCYDAQEDSWDYPACSIDIQDFDMGLDGGLVIRGSARNDRIGREVWLYDESGIRFPLTNDLFFDVDAFYAVTP